MATVQALAFSWKSFENKARCEKELRLATEVTSRADLSVQVKNQTGPVQIRAKAEFLVEVENQGSREATDVNVQAVLPGSLMFVNAGQNTDQSENAFVFSELLVAPGQTVTFKFTAIGVSKGDHVVRCTLQPAGSERKVISENAIYVRSLRGPDQRVAEPSSGPSISLHWKSHRWYDIKKTPRRDRVRRFYLKFALTQGPRFPKRHLAPGTTI